MYCTLVQVSDRPSPELSIDLLHGTVGQDEVRQKLHRGVLRLRAEHQGRAAELHEKRVLGRRQGGPRLFEAQQLVVETKERRGNTGRFMVTGQDKEDREIRDAFGYRSKQNKKDMGMEYGSLTDYLAHPRQHAQAAEMPARTSSHASPLKVFDVSFALDNVRGTFKNENSRWRSVGTATRGLTSDSTRK